MAFLYITAVIEILPRYTASFIYNRSLYLIGAIVECNHENTLIDNSILNNTYWNILQLNSGYKQQRR